MTPNLGLVEKPSDKLGITMSIYTSSLSPLVSLPLLSGTILCQTPPASTPLRTFSHTMHVSRSPVRSRRIFDLSVIASSFVHGPRRTKGPFRSFKTPGVLDPLLPFLFGVHWVFDVFVGPSQTNEALP